MGIEDQDDKISSEVAGEQKVVDNFEKHLDIAIEAQDGPAKAKEETPAENKGDTNTTDDKGGESRTSDSVAQPNADDKTGQAGEKQTHTPKDLKLADGTVVKGGAERRFYEQREVARQQLDTVRKDFDAAMRERDDFKSKFEQLEKTVSNLHGADPQQVAVGLNIVRDLQRDPPGTMKKLLAEVVAQGYTVEGIGAGIDAAAIKAMIEERLPANTNKEPTEAELVAEATNEANTFYSEFPDAKPHDALLARMLRDNPGVNLRTAYFDLKTAFAERGFDFALPLEDNLKQSGLATNKDTPTDTKNDNKAPLPNGGNLPNGDLKISGSNLAHEDADTGDIVKEAMREAGLKID